MQIRNIVAALLIGSVSTFTWAVESTASPNSNIVSAGSNTELINFVRSVVATNPRVQAARLALNASQAFQSAAARPLYNPELEFEAENADVQTRTLGISQTIDWGGKRSARTAVAAADRLAVEAEYLLTRRIVTTELLSGLAAYQTSAEHDALATERVRLMQEFAALAKRRFDAGDMTQVEFNLATLVFANARMKRATAAADLADAWQQVNNLTLSFTTSQWPKLDTQLPALATPSDPQSFLMTLPEVQAAQRRVDSTNAVVALRKREKRVDPTISLTGGEEDGKQLVGLNLSIPLPVRNSFSHEVTAAYEQYQQAQQMADDVLRRAHARFVSASRRYQIAQSAWQDWQQIGLSSLQQQGDQLRRLWEFGELSTTEFLVQTGQTIDSQDSALDLRQSLWRAWFEWLAASGQVDQWLSASSFIKSADSSTNLHSNSFVNTGSNSHRN